MKYNLYTYKLYKLANLGNIQRGILKNRVPIIGSL